MIKHSLATLLPATGRAVLLAGVATASLHAQVITAPADGAYQSNTNGQVAAGSNASSTGANAVAVGANAIASVAGSVALGSGSTTGAASSTAGNAALGIANNAGTAFSVVSIGGAAGQRQLQQLAAGQVSATSTDAVNGSQLFSVQRNVSLLGQNLATVLGGGASYTDSTGILTAPTYTILGGTTSSVGGAFTLINNNLRYFRVNSSGADAQAVGGQSVAIGSNARALTTGAIAMGNNAQARDGAGVAIGVNSTAINTGGGQAFGVAIGQNANANTSAGRGASPVAIGIEAKATGAGSQTAIGDQAVASGLNAVAIGGQAFSAGVRASGDNSTAIGQSAFAASTGAVAMGLNATVRTGSAGGIAFGNNTLVDANAGGGTAFGSNTRVGTASTGSAAIGGDARVGANAAGASAIGGGAQIADGAARSIAIGNGARVVAGAVDGLALGTNALVQVSGGAAIGLGSDTGTTAPSIPGFLTNQAAPANFISFGNAGLKRRLSNLADGGAPDDAVTVAQLTVENMGRNALGNAISTHLGGGATYDPLTGQIASPSFTVQGGNFSNVGAALAALDTAATTETNARNTLGNAITTHLGGGATYDPVTGQIAPPSYTVQGSSYGDVGSALSAIDTATTGNTTAITNLQTGLGNGTIGLVQQVGGAPGTGNLTVGATTAGTMVDFTGTSGTRTLAGVSAGVTPTDAVNVSQLQAATGNAVQYDDPSKSTITLGGPGGAPVSVTNLAPGAVAPGSTAAVNGGQVSAALTSVANTLGGGAGVDPATGTVTPPSYAVQGNTYNTIGGALTALDGATTNNSNAINALSNNVANGGVGPVRYANPGSPTTPNGGTPTQNLALVGAGAGPVTLDNVAAGELAAGSTQAVNGGQLFAAQQAAAKTGADTAAALGGGATHDPLTGAISAPTYAVQGSSFNNVGDALTALDGATAANTLAIAGNTSAITNLQQAVNAGTVGLVQQTGGAPGAGTITVGAATGGTVVDLTGSGGTRTLAGVTAGVADTDAVNVSQLRTSTANAVQYDDGSKSAITLGGSGAAPVALTNVAAGSVAPGSTAAVNGGQLAATNQALRGVADALGGGSTVDPTTGAVTAPSYAVQGVSYGNVGAAVAALDSGVSSAAGVASAATTAAQQAQATADAALQTAGNSVQYDAGRGSVTLNPGGDAVPMRNVGIGTLPTDAVNVGQLNASAAQTLSQANAYTDQALSRVSFDLARMDRKIDAAAASSNALAGLPQVIVPGMGMIAVALGGRGDVNAVAAGFSKAFDDGRTIFKAGATWESFTRKVGYSVGLGYQF
ncbi:beta strand repeat-containing protein [Sandaracinobacteroides saxicola]|uniref:Uncharacterized protein n=1 Tax=Sandaracinobacteroides saxicola TaxID=2759707 RepID=A0A7G5IFL3_9SPHN|nr:hypothetical protein [Sandaracinobacteroides saxicola]QMW22155.1 hypothetical protein H3309_12370 [Sandaracinobacteroides saxicola]